MTPRRCVARDRPLARHRAVWVLHSAVDAGTAFPPVVDANPLPWRMYSTCLFCNAHLGRNESLEHFPVGRRLAFDGAQGRLWVICPQCARWNLTPLETRWEAIEEAERAYRGTRLRSSTDNIGLAKLREGTTLVRIGRPLLPEFAGWRYGSVLRKRWLQQNTIAMSAMPLQVAGGVVLMSGGAPTPFIAVTAVQLGIQAALIARDLRHARAPRIGVRTNDGTLLRLSMRDAAQSRIVRHDNDEWSLRVEHRRTESGSGIRRRIGLTFGTRAAHVPAEITGSAAQAALRVLVPAANFWGGSRTEVSSAVDLVLERPQLAEQLLSLPGEFRGRLIERTPKSLGFIARPMLLALEIALHEADERRALEGELQELEARWREADEIAQIADRLLLPAEIDERLRTLR